MYYINNHIVYRWSSRLLGTYKAFPNLVLNARCTNIVDAKLAPLGVCADRTSAIGAGKHMLLSSKLVQRAAFRVQTHPICAP